jgi:hypothetical protein
MRNRKHHRWLLPLVLLIWIGVGFRFWSEEEPPLPQPVDTNRVAETKPLPFTEIAPFVLSLPYRDPFLSTIQNPLKPRPSGSKKQQAGASAPPALKYLGSVHSVKQAVGLLRWENGEVSSVQAGQQLSALTILKVEPERLVFRYRQQVYQLKRLGS